VEPFDHPVPPMNWGAITILSLRDIKAAASAAALYKVHPRVAVERDFSFRELRISIRQKRYNDESISKWVDE
jgi:hypothetical protein